MKLHLIDYLLEIDKKGNRRDLALYKEDFGGIFLTFYVVVITTASTRGEFEPYASSYRFSELFVAYEEFDELSRLLSEGRL